MLEKNSSQSVMLPGQHCQDRKDQGSVGLVKPSGTLGQVRGGAPMVTAQMVPSRILYDHEDQGLEAEP